MSPFSGPLNSCGQPLTSGLKKTRMSPFLRSQILSVTIFDKVPLQQVILGDDWTEGLLENANQLNPFTF